MFCAKYIRANVIKTFVLSQNSLRLSVLSINFIYISLQWLLHFFSFLYIGNTRLIPLGSSNKMQFLPKKNEFEMNFPLKFETKPHIDYDWRDISRRNVFILITVKRYKYYFTLCEYFEKNYEQ